MDTHASSAMPAMALVMAWSIRAVMENRARAARIATMTLWL